MRYPGWPVAGSIPARARMTRLLFPLALIGVVIGCTSVPDLTPAPSPTSVAVVTSSPDGSPTDEPTLSPTPNFTPTASPSAPPTPTASPSLPPTPTPSPSPPPAATPKPTQQPPQPGMTLLGTWTVHFFPDAALNGNGANIRLPAEKIDGTIVKPGDRFSFVTAVEPVNCPPYGKGGALVHGKIVEGKVCGGGMCSTSTTLFNAAARAGLAIVERHNHALYISRYPVGLDATVWDQGAGDGENMIFINDTGHPIEIKGYGKRRKVIFEIWGTDDGRKISFSDPVITNQKPAAMYMEYTDALAAGQTQKEWDNYDGFDAAVTRTVKDANGNVIHLDTFHSHYSLLNGLTMVGRYPDDPQAGTLILASDYPGKPPKPTPSPSPTKTPKSPSPPPSGDRRRRRPRLSASPCRLAVTSR